MRIFISLSLLILVIVLGEVSSYITKRAYEKTKNLEYTFCKGDTYKFKGAAKNSALREIKFWRSTTLIVSLIASVLFLAFVVAIFFGNNITTVGAIIIGLVGKTLTLAFALVTHSVYVSASRDFFDESYEKHQAKMKARRKAKKKSAKNARKTAKKSKNSKTDEPDKKVTPVSATATSSETIFGTPETAAPMKSDIEDEVVFAADTPSVPNMMDIGIPPFLEDNPSN